MYPRRAWAWTSSKPTDGLDPRDGESVTAFWLIVVYLAALYLQVGIKFPALAPFGPPGAGPLRSDEH